MKSSLKFMFCRNLEKRSKESKKINKFNLKMIAATNLAKAGSVDCCNSVATRLRASGKMNVATIRLLLRHKFRRMLERQVKNVATFKSYVTTLIEENA